MRCSIVHVVFRRPAPRSCPDTVTIVGSSKHRASNLEAPHDRGATQLRVYGGMTGKAWLGLLELVLTLLFVIGVVGAGGYLQGGWTWGVIGGIAGAGGAVYSIWKVTGYRYRR